MTPTEKQNLEKKICKHLSTLSYAELKELGINGQQTVKIMNGETVRFYAKTLARLRGLVEKKRVA
jgi:hypothetical protein